MPTLREWVRRVGDYVHNHFHWDTPEEEAEQLRAQTIRQAIKHGRMSTEHMPKRRKTEPMAQDNGASSAAAGQTPTTSSAASGPHPSAFPVSEKASGKQPQTNSPVSLLTDEQKKANDNIDSVRFGWEARKDGAAGGQAMAVVYEGATLLDVKLLLSELEKGVFATNLFGIMVDRVTRNRIVGELVLIRAKKEGGVFTFQFTFQIMEHAGSALIVLEQWFCWDDLVYVQDTTRLEKDTDARDICLFSSGVK